MPSRTAALQAWLEGFGMPAYAAQAVPDNAELPYLTYTPVAGAWGDGEQGVTVETWRRTGSEARANADAEAIGRALGLGGVMLACDGGGLWVKRGSPFWQAVDSGEPGVKRRYINLSIENITTF